MKQKTKIKKKQTTRKKKNRKRYTLGRNKKKKNYFNFLRIYNYKKYFVIFKYMIYLYQWP